MLGHVFKVEGEVVACIKKVKVLAADYLAKNNMSEKSGEILMCKKFRDCTLIKKREEDHMFVDLHLHLKVVLMDLLNSGESAHGRFRDFCYASKNHY